MSKFYILFDKNSKIFAKFITETDINSGQNSLLSVMGPYNSKREGIEDLVNLTTRSLDDLIERLRDIRRETPWNQS